MGQQSLTANLANLAPPCLSTSSLDLNDNYDIVSQNRQKQFSIVKQKFTQSLFIIKQTLYQQKQSYKKALHNLTQLQNIKQCQNTLNLKKVWTQSQKTLCSNSYKLYSLYQYSSIRLKDQISARMQENKYFQQQELLGVIQSALNSLYKQSAILFSETQFFIMEDGLLKVNNYDIWKCGLLREKGSANYSENQIYFQYQQGVYYCPQKMETFGQSNQDDYSEDYEGFTIPQSIFSLGVMLLHLIYLKPRLYEQLYSPFHKNKKQRFNYLSLQKYLNNLSTFNNCQHNQTHQKQILSEKLIQLVKRMVAKDRNKRPGLDETQQIIDDIVQNKNLNMEIKNEQQQQLLINNKYYSKIRGNNTHRKKYAIQQQNQIFNHLMSPINSNQLAKNKFTLNKKSINPLSTQTNIEKNKQTVDIDDLMRQIKLLPVDSISLSGQTLIPVINSRNTCHINSTQFNNIHLANLPSPIDSVNPLFTSPQFLAKINSDIKQFTTVSRMITNKGQRQQIVGRKQCNKEIKIQLISKKQSLQGSTIGQNIFSRNLSEKEYLISGNLNY